MRNWQLYVLKAFRDRYGTHPEWVVRAPGRINLIGGHTDYNDGFVLPMAINRSIWLALRGCSDGKAQVRSLDFEEERTFDLERFEKQGDGWVEYLKGTAWALREAGYPLQGWKGVMAGNIPIGAGLSSSAALELATARAFVTVGAMAWKPEEVARHCQRAENEWIGVNCGIMDQMVSASGVANHALLIDCCSLRTEPIPMPEDVEVVVMDTTVRRGLSDSAYNARRSQCEEAAQFFDAKALRDVDLKTFAAHADELAPTVRRRARHVLTENVRVVQAVQALKDGNVRALGRLMNASHQSLRDDFEVSSPELDAVVEGAQKQGACYGARMTGAGFGGCAVALVDSKESEIFQEAVDIYYKSHTGMTLRSYVCRPAQGVQLELEPGAQCIC